MKYSIIDLFIFSFYSFIYFFDFPFLPQAARKSVIIDIKKIAGAPL